MPGTMPATSQLDWLISITAMIVLFWSRATRDLLKSFGWGIAALHRLHAATKLPSLAARPIASIGPPPEIVVDPSGSRRDHRTKYGCLSEGREFDVSALHGRLSTSSQSRCSTGPGLIVELGIDHFFL